MLFNKQLRVTFILYIYHSSIVRILFWASGLVLLKTLWH